MAFTEFYCNTGGSNLNAGSTTATTAAFTYASGNWVQSTGVFTVASGDPASDGVAVGDFASVYPVGATVGVFVGRVTARDATTITVSLTAKSGTAPTDGTGNRTLKIGGAWKGPNAAEAFPFGFAAAAMTNASGDVPRVNLINGTNYAITANMNHNIAGPIVFQGYTSSPGDGGKATIDGGTSGASYILLTASGATCIYRDLILQNNGATGSAVGCLSSGQRVVRDRMVVTAVRGSGYNCTANGTLDIECEAYACNQANSGSQGGWVLSAPHTCVRCVSHNNNGVGFLFGSTGSTMIECVADTNQSHGFSINQGAIAVFIRCVAYANGAAGASDTASSNACYFESCAFESNGTHGAVQSGATSIAILKNCGFFSNTSGQTSGTVEASGTITLSASSMSDPANGNFVASTAEVKGLGRGSYTQTSGYTGSTTAYPDVGLQHQESAGGLIRHCGMNGGLNG